MCIRDSFSVHFEAFQDASGELAPGTLTDEQVAANYRYRAERINAFLGTDWATAAAEPGAPGVRPASFHATDAADLSRHGAYYTPYTLQLATKWLRRDLEALGYPPRT